MSLDTSTIAKLSVVQDIANYENLSLSEKIFLVGTQKSQILEGKIDVKYQEMQINNRKMQNLNFAMAVVSKYAADAKDCPKGEGVTMLPKYVDPMTGKEKEGGGSVLTVMHDCGIGSDINGATALTKEQWASLNAKLKAASDSLGSTSQMEMMKMQSVVNQLNEATQANSNLISKLNQIFMAIIGNLR